MTVIIRFSTASSVSRGAYIAGYDVLVVPNTVIVHRDGTTTHDSVPNDGTDIAELMHRLGARVG